MKLPRPHGGAYAHREGERERRKEHKQPIHTFVGVIDTERVPGLGGALHHMVDAHIVGPYAGEGGDIHPPQYGRAARPVDAHRRLWVWVGGRGCGCMFVCVCVCLCVCLLCVFAQRHDDDLQTTSNHAHTHTLSLSLSHGYNL